MHVTRTRGNLYSVTKCAYRTYSLYCQVTRLCKIQLMLARKFSISSWWLQQAPTLWRHDHNVDYQNMMVLPIVGGWLAMLAEENLPSNTMLMRWKVCKFKQSWLPWCLMPIGTIQQSNNMNTHNTVLTNNSVVVASSLTGNEDGTPSKTSWVQVWKYHFCWVSVSVFECTSSSNCSSSGLGAVLLITGLCFQLLLKTSLWHRMPVAAQWC